jgi:hypothetical protein
VSRVTAERMRALRAELAEATCADERLPVLNDIVDLAAELGQAGGEAAASAAAALDEVLAELRELRASAESADEDQYLMTLYLIAQAGLLRDSGSDLDDAIACLRELRDVLLTEPVEPAAGLHLTESPDAEEIQGPEEIMVEIEFGLGQALFRRLSRPGGGVTDLDDASAALAAALGWMASDAPGRPALTAALALQYATRYSGYSGTQDHRMAALALAAEYLASPGATEDATASCHVIVGWMSLTRQMNSEQRSAMLRRPEMEAARRGEAEAAAMIAALGEVSIDPCDAETALSHLRQVPDAASLDEDLTSVATTLSSLALFAVMSAGGVSDDIDRVADQLQSAAGKDSPDPLEQRELLAMRAALLGARASSEGHQDELRTTAETLQETAASLPEGHPFRGALLDQLGQSFRQQVNHAESADDFAAEIERIMDTLERMPRDDPQFARMLMSAAIYVLGAHPAHRTSVSLDRIITQLDRTLKRLAPEDPMKLVGDCMYWSAVGGKVTMDHRPDLVKEAITELRRCADQAPADSLVRPLVILSATSGLLDRYIMTGEVHLLEQAEKYRDEASAAIERATSATPGAQPALSTLRGMLLYLGSIIDLARMQHESGGQDLTKAVAGMEQVVDLMDPAHTLRPRMVADLEAMRALQELTDPAREQAAYVGPPERDAFDKILAQAQGIGRDHVDYPALMAQAAAGLMLQAVVDRDKAAMGRAISLLAEACSVPGLTYRERPRMFKSLGFALLTRYDLCRDARDLSLAIDRLEEARRAVEQELGSPYAADVLQTLASAYRIRGDVARGDVDRAVAVGLDALRERAGDVLLQDNDEDALRAARRVTSDAGEMARWFLSRGRSAAAVEALEFGRGTVLHAATSGARLAEVLQDAGRADLAAEWALNMSCGDAADDLRYRAMMAIEGSSGEVRLLAPPSLEGITTALAASHADALVYLLPKGEDGPGLAVLVDSRGNVESLPLPGLQTGPGSPVDSFLRARRAAEAAARRAAEGAADRRKEELARLASAEEGRRAALGELCDWTWRAAIGPVLAAMPARSRGSRRIVLVPSGELGLVAWHAARQPIAGGGYRYAAQEAVFSYASSARQFVSTAGRPPRPWTEAPVLISDAAASLVTTAKGIWYLHTAHYPAAAVFGYARIVAPTRLQAPGSDAATADDVLAALPRADSPGASVLHFGCHGEAQVPVLNSHLKLGEGNTVAVARILAQARRRSGQISGGLVVLASCLTDVAEADYDEAVTLATAFLSAGAAGVVAARWMVPDRDTALFMAAFHHYLNGIDRYPAQALRSAQAWMLDPGREPPGPLPKVLHDEVKQADLADPVAWAGFAYQGW